MTQETAKYKLTFTLSLSGLTLRASTEPFVADNGDIYDYTITQTAPLETSVGSLVDPKVLPGSTAVILDNQPNEAGARPSDLLGSYSWGNVSGSLAWGIGTDTSAYTTVFVGVTRFSGGISFDDIKFKIEMRDARAADATPLPPNAIDATTYPNAESKSLSKPIPLVWGDFRTTAGGGEKVPAYQIDSTEGTGGRFKVADHALAGIEAVYVNDVSQSFTASSGDLDDGEFVLNVSYTPASDTVTVNCEGATDDGTSSGTRLDTLPAICQDILETWASVDSANIDATAFAAWESSLGSVDLGRRWLGTAILSSALISEILSDGFADMSIVDGKYYPTNRIRNVGSVAQYLAGDIKPRGAGVKDFSVSFDPELIYCNQCYGDYRFDPIGQEYTLQEIANNASAQTELGQIVRRRLSMRWLYLVGGGEDRTGREAYVYGNTVEMMEVGIGPQALADNSGDIFRMIYGPYEETAGLGIPFLVRKITKNFKAMRAVIRAWNIFSLLSGTWTADGEPTWLSSSSSERSINGYWTDASGYADTTAPPSEESKRFVWI